jgi:hypothetical protein
MHSPNADGEKQESIRRRQVLSATLPAGRGRGDHARATSDAKRLASKLRAVVRVMLG